MKRHSESPTPSLAEQVKHAIQPLLGLKISRMSRAADMRTIQFGAVREYKGGCVGEYALHIQCPWRIENDTGISTGSGDLYQPFDQSNELNNDFDWEHGDNLQDHLLRQLLNGYDERTRQIVNSTTLLVVSAVEADLAGGFWLKLSGGYRLVVLPTGTRDQTWRLFRPDSEEEHFVVPYDED
jgi:hypothetical protein